MWEQGPGAPGTTLKNCGFEKAQGKRVPDVVQILFGAKQCQRLFWHRLKSRSKPEGQGPLW